MSQTIERIHLTVAGLTYALAPLESVGDLKRAVVEAVRAGGGFVDLTLDDGQRLSILVASASQIVISAQTVPLDSSHADGERYDQLHLAEPWDGEEDTPFDLI